MASGEFRWPHIPEDTKTNHANRTPEDAFRARSVRRPKTLSPKRVSSVVGLPARRLLLHQMAVLLIIELLKAPNSAMGRVLNPT